MPEITRRVPIYLVLAAFVFILIVDGIDLILDGIDGSARRDICGQYVTNMCIP